LESGCGRETDCLLEGWREVDSNLRFPNRSRSPFETARPVSHHGLIPDQEPMVRIHLPPAESLRTIGSASRSAEPDRGSKMDLPVSVVGTLAEEGS